MSVYANTESAVEWSTAQRLGADGIGLFRTENLFFEKDRQALRAMFLRKPFVDPPLAELLYDDHFRDAHIERLLPLFRVIGPVPIRVRLLDAPFAEWIPRVFSEKEATEILRYLQIERPALEERMDGLIEVNPAFGFRGSRLLIDYPELLSVQLDGILSAYDRARSEGHTPRLSILLPFLTGSEHEANTLKQMVQKHLKYRPIDIQAMLETPGSLAMVKQFAELFPTGCSIGTNDLTQFALAISRGDLRVQHQVYDRHYADMDPFTSMCTPVQVLIDDAMEKLAKAKMLDFPLTVCGRHAAEPWTINRLTSAGIGSFSVGPRSLIATCFQVARMARNVQYARRVRPEG